MEFEKSVYRIYQRLLQVGGCKYILMAMLFLIGCILVFASVNLGMAHSTFVNRSGTLKE